VRVLVTGATGCVGANVVEALLARGYDVRAMQRSTSRLDALDGLAPEMMVGDVLDLDSLRAAVAGCDWVIHAAAISQYWRNQTELIYRVNVEGTRNVVRAATEAGMQRLVYTSSAASLGLPSAPGAYLDESSTFDLAPERFPYAHSKVLAEAVVQEAVSDGLDAVIVNPVAVIGQRDIGFVGGEFLRAARQGKAVVAPPGGSGIVSARAVGVGHVLAAERGHTGERYILNGENLSFRELMKIVADVVGARPPRLVIPRPAMRLFAALVSLINRVHDGPPLIDDVQARLSAHEIYFDSSKAKRDLGFPHVSVRDAVEEAWTWYRTHGML
jgi:dihydroflavonol-4-reductase